MFITFTADNENISYFNEVGKRLLALMGHSGTIPGALKSDDVKDALTRLQQGLVQHKNPATPDQDEEEPEITLAKRAVPLVHLLETAVKKESDVLWDWSKSPS